MPDDRRRILRTLCLALAALALPGWAAPLTAQDSTAVPAGEWRVGGSIGLPGYRSETTPAGFTLGAHVTRVPARAVGLDLSVGTSPYILAHGSLALGARVGIVGPLRADSLLILPGAGLSFLALVGEGWAGTLAGYHVGVATVAASGIRLGLTLHWFAGDPMPAWLLELGFLGRPRR